MKKTTAILIMIYCTKILDMGFCGIIQKSLKINVAIKVLCLLPYRNTTKEYKDAMAIIGPIVEKHRSTMVAGEPALNYCDPSVMVCSIKVRQGLV